MKAPRRIQIEKRGDYVFMSVAREGEALQSAGGSFRIRLTEPFYVGLGVCAHDNNVIEKAVFSNVEIKQRPQPILESTLETVAIASKDRRVVYTKRAHFEAPIAPFTLAMPGMLHLPRSADGLTGKLAACQRCSLTPLRSSVCVVESFCSGRITGWPVHQ